MSYTQRRTKDQWQELVDECSKSGLSVKVFCEQKQINYTSFSKWKWKLKSKSNNTHISSALIKLNPTEPGSKAGQISQIAYTLPKGGSLTWNESVAATYIAELLRLIA